MRKPRAIVCDDEQSIQAIFRKVLEKMGYEVLTAATPVTCSLYREHADGCPQHNRCADILVTDHTMPDMTGLELLEMQHQRGCKLTSRNKALMTALADSELRERAEHLGCQFLSKPMSISTITAWVKECEKRIDLSEPLASDLYLPAMGKSFSVKSSGS
jgi:CheY-like chemotaxis protein